MHCQTANSSLVLVGSTSVKLLYCFISSDRKNASLELRSGSFPDGGSRSRIASHIG
ncbi:MULTISPECIES: hypothetical protein [Desertifilum]|uniref:Uncharacterized protein n=1 Tax=Desertifilum tharense IPPAS B-1220 TaxID=1781255 RepID=A0ACD5GVN5_9CYAN|nr:MULTISPECIES: hypothetical protein [Desertifilum]MBD2320654.1 hypothetical protein [Desertifilum sp. FACHB-866]MBD2330782.1 hypothetical protein [Desertifilum sp. FACHB-868]